MKSRHAAGRTARISERLSVSVGLIVFGLVSQPVLPSTHVLKSTNSTAAALNQGAERTPNAGNGIIAGVVVNEQQEPVVRAQVQAFSVRTAASQVQQQQSVPFAVRATGSASTDTQGRFQISGLDLGEYLVAAEAVPSLTSGESRQTAVYATTFYPSTIDHQVAVQVPAQAYGATPIQIELVRVNGVRLAGSVMSRSGGPTSGMDVRLFHRFGDPSPASPLSAPTECSRFFAFPQAGIG
jgi:hypothetical protein